MGFPATSGGPARHCGRGAAAGRCVMSHLAGRNRPRIALGASLGAGPPQTTSGGPGTQQRP